MTGLEYQLKALRTAGEYPTKYDMLRNSVYGLNGESGEVIDLLKKHEFQGHELDAERVLDELGDILWYIALGCEALDTTLDTLMQMNIYKLEARYPDGFDAERSINRG